MLMKVQLIRPIFKMRHLPVLAASVVSTLSALLIGGCQTGEPVGGALHIEVAGSAPVAALSAINEQGQECWIRSGDKEFRGLALIPELDTTAGRPRLLIVEKGKARGLPKLVIEAAGDPVKIATYGPLASQPVSRRINDDVIAWTQNKKFC